MALDAELVILGGGCAGLSLAWRLAQLGARAPKTLVIESRQVYRNDRTWCFWDDGTPWIQALVAHTWKRLRVSHRGQHITLRCDTTPYQLVSAQSFYTAAIGAIHGAAAVRLQLGTDVDDVREVANHRWEIETSQGSLSAAMVVDTRPARTPAVGGATLWQSFSGAEIECRERVFDPLCADLMDFTGNTRTISVLGSGPSALPFTYVLPLTAYRALVETTVFSPQPLQPEALALQLEQAITARTRGAAWTVKRTEHGILPMGLVHAPPSKGKGHVHVGVMAGAARPSTGYAFQRIQQWADRCSASIASGTGPVGHAVDGWLSRTMDQLFLQVVRADPHNAPALFMAMFEHVPPARLIRFLSGSAGWADQAALVRALPASPFIRQLCALPRGRQPQMRVR